MQGSVLGQLKEAERKREIEREKAAKREQVGRAIWCCWWWWLDALLWMEDGRSKDPRLRDEDITDITMYPPRVGSCVLEAVSGGLSLADCRSRSPGASGAPSAEGGDAGAGSAQDGHHGAETGGLPGLKPCWVRGSRRGLGYEKRWVLEKFWRQACFFVAVLRGIDPCSTGTGLSADILNCDELLVGDCIPKLCSTRSLCANGKMQEI